MSAPARRGAARGEPAALLGPAGTAQPSPAAAPATAWHTPLPQTHAPRGLGSGHGPPAMPSPPPNLSHWLDQVHPSLCWPSTHPHISQHPSLCWPSTHPHTPQHRSWCWPSTHPHITQRPSLNQLSTHPYTTQHPFSNKPSTHPCTACPGSRRWGRRGHSLPRGANPTVVGTNSPLSGWEESACLDLPPDKAPHAVPEPMGWPVRAQQQLHGWHGIPARHGRAVAEECHRSAPQGHRHLSGHMPGARSEGPSASTAPRAGRWPWGGWHKARNLAARASARQH